MRARSSLRLKNGGALDDANWKQRFDPKRGFSFALTCHTELNTMQSQPPGSQPGCSRRLSFTVTAYTATATGIPCMLPCWC
jgi:hypothetical protein